jgi:hypothetical protein
MSWTTSPVGVPSEAGPGMGGLPRCRLWERRTWPFRRKQRQTGRSEHQWTGAWLSWLERSLHTAEVGGSSPLAPTLGGRALSQFKAYI